MTKESMKLAFKEKFGYAGGDFASNIFWMTFIFYGTMYYTDAFGLLPAAVAAMFGLVRSIDSGAMFVMGIVADRTNTKHGKFRPFMLYLAIPFGIVGALCFFTPDIDMSGKVVYAYGTYLAFGLMYAAINIPYSSLLGVISSDPQERASASKFRFIGAFSAGAMISFFLPSMVKIFGVEMTSAEKIVEIVGVQLSPEALDKILAAKEMTAEEILKVVGAAVPMEAIASLRAKISQTGFLLSMGLFSLLAIVLWFGAFLTTKERIKPPKTQDANILKDIKSIVTNVPWLILFLLGLFTLSYVSIRNASAAFYIKYYVGEQTLFGMNLSIEALMGWFNGIGMLAAIAGTALLTTSMSKRLGKKKAYIALMGLSAALTIIYYWLPPDAVLAILVLQTLVSVFMGPTTPLVFAMYTDAVDYSEWKDGRRATGLVMSASGLAQSLGWTVGGFLGGLLLSYYGYEANKEQTPETIEGIKSLISWIPALGAVLATVAMLVYPLSEKRMKEIVADLEARRKAEGGDDSDDEADDDDKAEAGVTPDEVSEDDKTEDETSDDEKSE